jgi:acyl-CoA reductase-like NAD-dependent aldehyde dehydrogenase
MSRTFSIISPVDQRTLAIRPYAEPDALHRLLRRARNASENWRAVPLEQRAGLVRRFVQALVDRRGKIATDVSWQMGRPFAQADETGRLAAVTEQLIEDAKVALGTVEIKRGDGIDRRIEADPLGVILSICTWNYPVAMAASLIVAPLLAGNVVIFKHAPQTAIIGDYFMEAARASDLPDGVFAASDIHLDDLCDLIRNGEFDGIQFIGSTRAGSSILACASERLIKTCLELGGNDPSYVRDDADLVKAVEGITSGRYGNSGQSCCAVKRLYLHRNIYDDFMQAFGSAVLALRTGHPLEETPDIGPVISATAASNIRAVLGEAIASGGRAILPSGRVSLDAEGTAYVAPQIVVDVDHSMRIMREEVFGPLIGVMKVSSDEEAVALMNDSEYGLTASIWSADSETSLAVGRKVKSGTFYLNACDHADMNLPFGGVKKSGYGRSYSRLGYSDIVSHRAYHLRRSPTK